jgi:phytoene dehydrogenase-like protein
VRTEKGDAFAADVVVFNIPLENIVRLFDGDVPAGISRRRNQKRKTGWGAYMLYLGVDGTDFERDFVLHQQVVTGNGLGEGDTIFISTSPEWDKTRAPVGHRAITVSTHTKLGKWWELFESKRDEYENRKNQYQERILNTANEILPGLRERIKLCLPGTPVTFQRFTGREKGWVGGYPQESIFSTYGPRLGNGLWMVGDSTFPGQSVPAVLLGGLRASRAIQKSAG